MSGSDQRRATVPEVARLLGISERGVRDKIEHGQLVAEKIGKRWIVLLPPDVPEADAVVRGSSSGSPSGSDAVVEPMGSTIVEVERAIARTGQQYTADLRAILGELRQVYEGQIAAKDQTIAAKDETIAGLRREVEELRAQASPQPPTAEETPHTPASASLAPAPAQGFWRRVRRAFGGE